MLTIFTALASSLAHSIPFLTPALENDPETARLNIMTFQTKCFRLSLARYDLFMSHICQPDDTDLEGAQKRKLESIIVLEIGSGWGSFACLEVKSRGCRVSSLMLSERQKEVVERRIRVEGLEGKIGVLLCDYRNLRKVLDECGEDKRRFDRVVSIEMLEAVGEKFLSEYFRVVDDLLKPGRGIGVFQCITIPEAVSFYMSPQFSS
jgi:cyclopropane fatty-acyl-phospholipid synthase-like methyltransferase